MLRIDDLPPGKKNRIGQGWINVEPARVSGQQAAAKEMLHFIKPKQNIVE